LVLDLEDKIETHNKTVISSDSNIKQQIELLTRHTLSKKTIDWMSQKNVLVKSAGEMEALNNKVRRLEMKEYNSSSLLNSVAVDMDNFVNEGRSVTTNTSTITTREIVDHGVIACDNNNNSNLVASSSTTVTTNTNVVNNNTVVTFTTTTNSSEQYSSSSFIQK
jgi:hypothetical protein